MFFSDITEWKCVRCRQRDDLAVRTTSCHLCELRGGALIPAENVLLYSFLRMFYEPMDKYVNLRNHSGQTGPI